MKTPLPEPVQSFDSFFAGLSWEKESMATTLYIEEVATAANAIRDYLKEREEAPRVERCGLGIMKREEVEERPKRWRADRCKTYLYVSSCGYTRCSEDNRDEIDNFRYNTGNYFQTEAEAEAYRERLLEMGKE